MPKRAAFICLGVLALGMTSAACLGRPANADGPDVGAYEKRETQALKSGGGYFGRKQGTTSIEVTGSHAGGSKFTLHAGHWIARIGVLGYMKNSPADGTLAIYKDTATPDIKQHVCHTVTGPFPVGRASKAWTVLEVSGGPVWLDAGDYWILRNDSGSFRNKFVIAGEKMESNKWGWCYIKYPNWPENTWDLTWVENYSNVEGCFYAEWDPPSSVRGTSETMSSGSSGAQAGFQFITYRIN